MNQKKVVMLIMVFACVSLFASEFTETEKIVDSVLLHNYEDDCYVIYETKNSIKTRKENIDGTGEEYVLFSKSADIKPLSRIYEITDSGVDSAIFVGEVNKQKKIYVATTDFITNEIYINEIMIVNNIEVVLYELNKTRNTVLFYIEKGKLKQMEIDYRKFDYITKEYIPEVEFTECVLRKKKGEESYYGYGVINRGINYENVFIQIENEKYIITEDYSENPYRLICNDYNSYEIIDIEKNWLKKIIFGEELQIKNEKIELEETLEKENILGIVKNSCKEIEIFYKEGNTISQKKLTERQEVEKEKIFSCEQIDFVKIEKNGRIFVIQDKNDGTKQLVIIKRNTDIGILEEDYIILEDVQNITEIKVINNKEWEEKNVIIIDREEKYRKLFSSKKEVFDFLKDSISVNGKIFSITQKNENVIIQGWRY